MICKKCGGLGFLDGNFTVCDACNGSGRTNQTNNEWRKNCSAEEFAEWVSDIVYGCKVGDCMDFERIVWCSKADVIKWLKEKHEQA